MKDTQKGSFSIADGNVHPLQSGFGGVLVRYLGDVCFHVLSDVYITGALVGKDDTFFTETLFDRFI